MKKNLKNTTKIIISVVEKVITALVLIASIMLVYEGAILPKNEELKYVGFAMSCLVELVSILKKKETTSIVALTVIVLEYSLAQMKYFY